MTGCSGTEGHWRIFVPVLGMCLPHDITYDFTLSHLKSYFRVYDVVYDIVYMISQLQTYEIICMISYVGAWIL